MCGLSGYLLLFEYYYINYVHTYVIGIQVCTYVQYVQYTYVQYMFRPSDLRLGHSRSINIKPTYVVCTYIYCIPTVHVLILDMHVRTYMCSLIDTYVLTHVRIYNSIVRLLDSLW